MGRVEYDQEFFRPVLASEAFEESPDASGEIAAGITRPDEESATRCEFDEEGDLVYGEEVPILSYPDELVLTAEFCDNPLGLFSRVVESPDTTLKSHTVLFSGYPFSTNKRGKANFNRIRKDVIRDRDFWLPVYRKLKDGQRLQEIVDQYNYDLWRTSNSLVVARFFEPRLDAASAFGGRGPSKKDYEQADEQLELQARGWHDEPLHPTLRAIFRPVAIKLWGICEEYEKAYAWLQFHEQTQKLIEAAKQGKLFQFYPISVAGSEPPPLHPAAEGKTDEILEASIHNALCGTFDPHVFRGVVKQKKQTVATNLKYLFLDGMYQLHRRATRGMPLGGVPALDEVGAQDAGIELQLDINEIVSGYRAQLDETEPLRRGLLGRLVGALRSGDAELVIRAVAMAVALRKTEDINQGVEAIIRDLTTHPDRQIATMAASALEMLDQPDP